MRGAGITTAGPLIQGPTRRVRSVAQRSDPRQMSAFPVSFGKLRAREKDLRRDRTPSVMPRVLPPVSFGSRCGAFKKTSSYQPHVDDDDENPLESGQKAVSCRDVGQDRLAIKDSPLSTTGPAYCTSASSDMPL